MKINKNLKIEPRDIFTADELINELEILHRENGAYIFRGQHNSKFSLLPGSFRDTVIKKRVEEFPATPFYQEWCLSNELKSLLLPPFTKEYIHSLHVRRICELTFYVMHYNYFLANHVQENNDRFDSTTLKMYELRPPLSWTEKNTFLDLFQYGFSRSIGRVTLDGKIINYSDINEEMASYDESLPQHYDTQTAAIDFTLNPFIAIYFALKNIPDDASHFSIYAYKQLQDSEKNPIILRSGNPECKNPRIKKQEGLFIGFRYAALYYFIHGIWPSVETFMPVSDGMFELIKFIIPVGQVSRLKQILEQKGITEEYLLPDMVT